jgi:large subunit ribosomal protein L25
LADVELPEGVTLISDEEAVAVTVTPPTEVSDEEMEAAGIVEEPSDETEAEEAEVEEGTEEIPVEERETGPAGQNLQP